MKLKETPSYTQHSDTYDSFDDEIGDNHISTSIDTPMRNDAFEISDTKKKKITIKSVYYLKFYQ